MQWNNKIYKFVSTGIASISTRQFNYNKDLTNGGMQNIYLSLIENSNKNKLFWKITEIKWSGVFQIS